MKNREIKFRAWDSAYKSMHEVEGILFSENEIWIKNNELNKSSCELMQYTGLKDKNGKDIYEGDVLEHSVFTPKESRNKSVVIFIDGYFSAIGLYEIDKRKVEVIGNIHENKDLL